MDRRLASLDGLRGLAALAVALPHFLLILGPSELSEAAASLAVEVFFVLSGFVLGPQIIRCFRSRDPADLKIFLVRRWMRTVPPYLIALLIASAAAGKLFGDGFWHYAFYAQNLFTAPGDDYYPIAWSLSVEEWFYVIVPALLIAAGFLTRCRGDRAALFFAVLFIAAVTWLRLAVGDHGADWGAAVRRVVVFRIDSIAYGFVLFLLVGGRDLGRHKAVSAFALVLASSAAIGAMMAIPSHYGARIVFPVVAAAFGCAWVTAALALRAAVETRPALAASCLFMGRISYSLYLLHLSVATLLAPRIGAWPLPAAIAAYLSVCGALCACFYAYVEAPILALRPRYDKIVPSVERKVWLQNLGLALGSTVVSLVAVELGLRVFYGLPLLPTQNLLLAHEIGFNSATDYDPVVGWVLKPNYSSGNLHTGEFGLRMNSAEVRPLPQGGILAIGDSFVLGALADDDGTWPAELERRLGVPVNNAGVAAWGLDQITLRIGQLVPALHPKAVILTVRPENLDLLRYSFLAAPKPYFVLQDGRLTPRNMPVPHYAGAATISPDQAILGYSEMINWTKARLGDGTWGKIGAAVDPEVQPDAVACALVKTLHADLASKSVRLLIATEWSGATIEAGQETPAVVTLLGCARADGIETVDTFPDLTHAYKEDPTFKGGLFFMQTPAVYDHMTARGNDMIASILAPHFGRAALGTAEARTGHP